MERMRVVSVNVSLPKRVPYKGRTVSTAIFKEPVAGRIRVRTAVLEATNPRYPCFKLGIRFGREDIEARFLASGRSGFYFRVVREGDVEAGDPIERAPSPKTGPSITEVVRARIDEEEAEE